MAGLVDKASISAEEHTFLLAAGKRLGEAESGLKENDFGIVHGALRAFFNGVGKVSLSSEYLDGEKKHLLEELNDKVFNIRNELVNAVELEMKNLADVANEKDTYKRLEKVQTTFTKYLNEWYSP